MVQLKSRTIATIASVALVATAFALGFLGGCLYKDVQAMPTETTIDVRLRDLNSDLAWLDSNGVAMVSADQDILVWVNLPVEADQLTCNFKAVYPELIPAGTTGVIRVTATTIDGAKYTGAITIGALDDLHLGTKHYDGDNVYLGSFDAKNRCSTANLMDEARQRPHLTFSLYTSCEVDYGSYDWFCDWSYATNGYIRKDGVSVNYVIECLYTASEEL